MTEVLTTSTFRKTLASITATVNPENIKTPTLLNLVEKGVTIFRLNLSYFEDNVDKKKRLSELITNISNLSKEKNIVLGIMLDTMGPEFRVGKINPIYQVQVDEKHKGIKYEKGKEINLKLVANLSDLMCDDKNIIVEDTHLTEFINVAEKVRFGDGEFEAEIMEFDSSTRTFKINPVRPIRIWEKSKVNFPKSELNAPALNRAELDAFNFFINEIGNPNEIQYIFAQSFVKSVEDITKLKNFLDTNYAIHERFLGSTYKPIIIAKFETYESVQNENLKEIIKKSSAIMIARGDLANETSREKVPGIQRKIVKIAKELGKPVLLATEVYKSMSKEDVFQPTRPEAEDVRCALEQGVDGFVLTGETTSRPDPETVVEALANQIKNDEKNLIKHEYYKKMREPVRDNFHKEMKEKIASSNLTRIEKNEIGTTDSAIAAVFRANAFRAIGLFPFTAEGGTVKEMCRFFPETQIFALTPDSEAAQLLLLYRCVHPILIKIDEEEINNFEINELKSLVKKVVDILELRKFDESDVENSVSINPRSNYAIATLAHPALKKGATDSIFRISFDSNNEQL